MTFASAESAVLAIGQSGAIRVGDSILGVIPFQAAHLEDPILLEESLLGGGRPGSRADYATLFPAEAWGANAGPGFGGDIRDSLDAAAHAATAPVTGPAAASAALPRRFAVATAAAATTGQRIHPGIFATGAALGADATGAGPWERFTAAVCGARLARRLFG